MGKLATLAVSALLFAYTFISVDSRKTIGDAEALTYAHYEGMIYEMWNVRL